MEIIRDPAQMTAWSSERINEGKTVSLVPTMGYFHEGHLQLMRMAGRASDVVVVSLFVNPLQFGPSEDLASYPSKLDRDSEMAQKEGAAVLFAPEVSTMYSKDSSTRITVGRLTKNLCAIDRPGHFEGVTTVVGKLFHIVKPHVAVFGEKDFQQLAVIRKMVSDLNWDVEVLGHPIVREPDGLALSSRNTYLDPQNRQSALSLSKAIQLAKRRIGEGVFSTRKLQAELRDFILSHPGTAVDYISFVDCHNLEAQKVIDHDTVLAVAVKIDNKVRLIDNSMIYQNNKLTN